MPAGLLEGPGLAIGLFLQLAAASPAFAQATARYGDAAPILRGQAHPRMPFGGPPYLAEDNIRLIEDRIDQGSISAESRPARLPVGAGMLLRAR